ncbi:hypothetical protein [Lentilactobacillus parabuchneri]|uniref:hypothetical protein n=1 Tax=Lentilactobacillus parabuchneri TaxID=152331 RepID=UPI002307F9A6|nr:hypothetical protein [Lentilactobacillus parabuchneri]MDB1102391.1 hypothetical protein [Lentilactobacillus parabuchneri]
MVKVENKTQFNRVINGVMVKRGLNDLLQKDFNKVKKALADPLIKPLVADGQLVIEDVQQSTKTTPATNVSTSAPIETPDVANMNVADATNAIRTISDKSVLAALLKSETTSANRKGVVDVIKAKLK